MLDVALAQLPRLQADFSVRAGGAAIAVRSVVDVKAGAGTLELSGALTPALLSVARRQSSVAVLKWVELHEPAPVHATVEFAPGWRPARAEADISVRHVTAHDVPLDAAAGHVTYAGHDLQVTDLLLLLGRQCGAWILHDGHRHARLPLPSARPAASARHLRLVQGLVAAFLG